MGQHNVTLRDGETKEVTSDDIGDIRNPQIIQTIFVDMTDDNVIVE
ncbi:hypothetical protein CENSYa_1186 [Cenarchaeum symbiosum A]|uniref:Uncharacterized protein n=1 Tax=Cenarchaeum symbiosum (strain A) TaxID=414004 RepID=A0RWU3_CENSY|nr:hypothetical protein CENSYa_1186 [Cenarchaeum symbiosum A]